MTETIQELQKRRVRSTLERIWARWQLRCAENDHQLVVIAVPTYPADIEAVSAMDMQDVADLLAAFTKHREDHPDELHAIKPPTGEPPQSTSEAIGDGQEGISTPEPLGQGDDGGRASPERAEPAPEQDEGDAAPDPMGRPVFELIPDNGDPIIHIWASGRVDNFAGGIINRLPGRFMPMVVELKPDDIERLEKEWTPGYITYIDHLTPSIMDPPGTPLRKSGFNAGDPIWPDNDQSNDLDIEPLVFNPTSGIPKTSYGEKSSPSFDSATWFSTTQPSEPSGITPWEDANVVRGMIILAPMRLELKQRLLQLMGLDPIDHNEPPPKP